MHDVVDGYNGPTIGRWVDRVVDIVQNCRSIVPVGSSIVVVMAVGGPVADGGLAVADAAVVLDINDL